MPVSPSDLRSLAEPFPADAIEWKPGTTTRDGKKALAMAYLTSRAIMDRLDEVCGPANWRNEFAPGPGGGIVCGLSIIVARDDRHGEWITKWDGAENTDVESVKGGLSNATKRAAVQWGIGRYLYGLPTMWLACESYQKGNKLVWKKWTEQPRLPARFLPNGNPAKEVGTTKSMPFNDPPAMQPRRGSTTRVVRKAGER
ncbi:MAG: Rad52/Rad22 family DNA repair protein [Bacteroidota bacterium]